MKSVGIGWVAVVASVATALAPVAPAFAESAVRYYPGKDVVIVTVVETITATATVKDTGTAFTVNRSTTIRREGAVVIKTIADTSHPKTLDLQSRGLTDASFSVELSEDSLLRAINLSSAGRFGDFLTSVAKIAGVAFALAGAATGTAMAHVCNGHDPAFAMMPVNARYFIEQSANGCTLARQVGVAQKSVQQREAELRSLEDRVAGATGTELNELQKRIPLARVSLDEARKTLATQSQSLAAALSAFQDENELGTVQKGQSTQTAVLQLTDLPPSIVLKDDISFPDAQAALTEYVTAKAVLDRLKVALTLEAQIPGQPKPEDDPRSTDQEKTVTVCFRQSIPVELRVLLLKSSVTEYGDGSADGSSVVPAKLREVSHSIENVLHPSTPLTCPAFKASAFADRKLALVFDAKGRPQKIEREEKSSPTAVAAALATASSTLLSNTAANLKTLEGIQASRRTLSLNDLTTRAERLKQEKAVLDAQLQLEGGQATFDSALKQQKLQADLNALNADVQLAAAEETRDQRQDIERMKIAIDQLQKSLELLKAQQELDKARK